MCGVCPRARGLTKWAPLRAQSGVQFGAQSAGTGHVEHSPIIWDRFCCRLGVADRKARCVARCGGIGQARQRSGRPPKRNPPRAGAFSAMTASNALSVWPIRSAALSWSWRKMPPAERFHMIGLCSRTTICAKSLDRIGGYGLRSFIPTCTDKRSL